ncbi:MAG: hypothetical protein ACI3XF_02020 [Eubacteriales bacterium]
MSENKRAELTSHYCPKIDDNVFVMSVDGNDGGKTRRCLSSHLCREDERASCGHTDEKRGGAGLTI